MFAVRAVACVARRAVSPSTLAAVGRRCVSATTAVRADDTVPVTYVFEGESIGTLACLCHMPAGALIEACVRTVVNAKIGENFMDIAHEHDIDIEGACGGELACSTCHVILDQKFYDMLPDPEEEEEDMLDLAWGLQDT